MEANTGLPAPVIRPIRDDDLPDACRFAHEHLAPLIPVSSWIRAFRYSWPSKKPNNGFMLRTPEGEIVGVFFAIYSIRRIRGQTMRYCNLTSWCVLPEYRGHSLSLALSILSQRGFQFVNLSPNEQALRIFRKLGFRRLDRGLIILPVPLGFLGKASAEIVTDLDVIDAKLDEPARTIFRHHRDAPAVRHLGLDGTGVFRHLMYWKRTRKRIPSVDVLYLSGPAALQANWPSIARYFWARYRVFLMTIPSNYSMKKPFFSLLIRDPQPLQYKDEGLMEQDIDFLYSERVMLGRPADFGSA